MNIGFSLKSSSNASVSVSQLPGTIWILSPLMYFGCFIEMIFEEDFGSGLQTETHLFGQNYYLDEFDH